jgi:hypothetical protein
LAQLDQAAAALAKAAEVVRAFREQIAQGRAA